MRNNKILCVIVAVIAAIAAAISAAVLFFKHRERKRGFTAFALIAVMLCGVIATPLSVYALTDEDKEREVDLGEILTPVITPAPTPMPTPEPTPTPEPQPITPPGNLTLVDDIAGEQAEDKQFITVVTKSGNYFYIVIDRAADEENVHFMNLVDEADLLAIIEKDKKPEPTPAPTPTPEPTPEPAPAPEAPQKGNPGGILIVLLLLGALGGGAFYYFKVLKPKQAEKTTASTELDEFSFDEDEEDTGELETDGAREPDGYADAPDYDEDGEVPDFTFDGDTTESEGTE